MGGINPVGRKGYETWNVEKVKELPPIHREPGESYRQEVIELLQREAPKNKGQWYKVFESPTGNARSASALASKLKHDIGSQFEVRSRAGAIYARFVGRSQQKAKGKRKGSRKKAA